MFLSATVFTCPQGEFTFDPQHDQIGAVGNGQMHIILNAAEALVWRDSLTKALARRDIWLEAQPKPEEQVASVEPPNPEEF